MRHLLGTRHSIEAEMTRRETKEPIRVRRLTDVEHHSLLRWVKSDTVSARLRRRARAILLSSYGISAYLIALLIPMGRNNVVDRIRRFNVEGLEGLYDRPRSGRPRRRDSQRTNR